MKVKKYNTETNSYIEIETIGKVKYIGKSFGLEGLTDGKIYKVIGIENGMLRIIDDSEEDYLYSITRPACLTDISSYGRWEIVEDNENKWLEKLLSHREIQINYADNKIYSIEYIN